MGLLCCPRHGSGAEASRAWALLRQLNDAGRDTTATLALESKVLQALYMATEGGPTFGSSEHEAVVQRILTLGHLQLLTDSGEEGGGAAVVVAEFGIGCTSFFSALALEGIGGYPGPMTRETLHQSGAFRRECLQHWANAATASSADEAVALVVWHYHTGAMTLFTRQHALPDFSFEAECGKGGARLRENIKR